MAVVESRQAEYAAYAFLGALVLALLHREQRRNEGAQVRPKDVDEAHQLRRLRKLLATAAACARHYQIPVGLEDEERSPGLGQELGAYSAVVQLLPLGEDFVSFVPAAHRTLGELIDGWKTVSDKEFAAGPLEQFLVRLTHAAELAPREGCF